MHLYQLPTSQNPIIFNKKTSMLGFKYVPKTTTTKMPNVPPSTYTTTPIKLLFKKKWIPHLFFSQTTTHLTLVEKKLIFF